MAEWSELSLTNPETSNVSVKFSEDQVHISMDSKYMAREDRSAFSQLFVESSAQKNTTDLEKLLSKYGDLSQEEFDKGFQNDNIIQELDDAAEITHVQDVLDTIVISSGEEESDDEDEIDETVSKQSSLVSSTPKPQQSQATPENVNEPEVSPVEAGDASEPQMESTEEEDSLVEGVDNTDELSSQPSTSEQCRTIQIKRGRPRFEIPGFDNYKEGNYTQSERDKRHIAKLKLYEMPKYLKKVKKGNIRKAAYSWRKQCEKWYSQQTELFSLLEQVESQQEPNVKRSKQIRIKLDKLSVKIAKKRKGLEDYERNKKRAAEERQSKKRKLPAVQEEPEENVEHPPGKKQELDHDVQSVEQEEKTGDQPPPLEGEESEVEMFEEEPAQKKPKPLQLQDMMLQEPQHETVVIDSQDETSQDSTAVKSHDHSGVTEASTTSLQRIMQLEEQLTVEMKNKSNTAQVFEGAVLEFAHEKEELLREYEKLLNSNRKKDEYITHLEQINKTLKNAKENAVVENCNMKIRLAKLHLTSEETGETGLEMEIRRINTELQEIKAESLTRTRTLTVENHRLISELEKANNINKGLSRSDGGLYFVKCVRLMKTMQRERDVANKQLKNWIEKHNKIQSDTQFGKEEWLKKKIQILNELEALQKSDLEYKEILRQEVGSDERLNAAFANLQLQKTKELDELKEKHATELETKERLIETCGEQITTLQEDFQMADVIINSLASNLLEPDNPNNLDINYHVTKLLEQKNFHEAFGPRANPGCSEDQEESLEIPEHSLNLSLDNIMELEHEDDGTDADDESEEDLETEDATKANTTNKEDAAPGPSNVDGKPPRRIKPTRVRHWKKDPNSPFYQQDTFFKNECYVYGPEKNDSDSCDEPSDLDDEERAAEPHWKEDKSADKIDDDDECCAIEADEHEVVKALNSTPWGLAGDMAYTYSSRGYFGRPVMPEPETFEEATQQLKDHEAYKAKFAAGSGTDDSSEDSTTDEDEDEQEQKMIYAPLSYDYEAFGDKDDENIKRLLAKGNDRTPYENIQFKKLCMLRYQKTRAVRSRQRASSNIVNVEARLAKLMKSKNIDSLKSVHKLPDWKIHHLLRFKTQIPDQMYYSPFCWMTRIYKSEAEFMADKFETCEQTKERRDRRKKTVKAHKAKQQRERKLADAATTQEKKPTAE